MKEECQRFEFKASAWNDLSMSFYRKLNAVDITETIDVHAFRIEAEDLQQLAAQRRPVDL